MRLCDPLENAMQSFGLSILEDLETGEQLFVDVNDPRFQKEYLRIAQENAQSLRYTFTQTGTDCLELNTQEPIADALLRFMQLRKRQPARSPVASRAA